MNDTATAPWDLSISASDFEKLKVGLSEPTMDERWKITLSPTDSDPENISRNNGKISVVSVAAGQGRHIISFLFCRLMTVVIREKS